jgi:hypothetical protein
MLLSTLLAWWVVLSVGMMASQQTWRELRRRLLLGGSVDRDLECYPEQVEDQDQQPSRHAADSADDEGQEVDRQVVE